MRGAMVGGRARCHLASAREVTILKCLDSVDRSVTMTGVGVVLHPAIPSNLMILPAELEAQCS